MEKNLENILKNSKVMHPLFKSRSVKNRYWKDFLILNKDYQDALSEKEYESFLDKSQLDCKIEIPQYLQFAAEATVVDYIIRNYNDFRYEPRYNNKKNPECSFEYKGRTVNVEVKCPDMTKRIQQENAEGIKLFPAERFPKISDYTNATEIIKENINNKENIQSIDRMDNKLKDFLISAHQKFPVSDATNFNILVIALDTAGDMDEWYSYLFGDTGVLTEKTFISDDYSNVDAVMITNIQNGHMSDDNYPDINCWNLENYISLLFLNPLKAEADGNMKYYTDAALDLFGGLTCKFLAYLDEQDRKNKLREDSLKKSGLNNNQISALTRMFYQTDKIRGLHIVSEWGSHLLNPDTEKDS